MNVLHSGDEKAVLATGTDENSETVTELYDKMGYFAEEGFRLSDGSTTFVLESWSGMRERGAKPYAEILGCGTASCSAQSGSEDALERAALLALDDAGITAGDIDGIVGFANGLSEVDRIENELISNVFGERAGAIPVFNIRSVTGEGRAATAALSAAHAALIFAGKLGKIVESENLGMVAASVLKNILVISYSDGGTYTAVIITR